MSSASMGLENRSFSSPTLQTMCLQGCGATRTRAYRCCQGCFRARLRQLMFGIRPSWSFHMRVQPGADAHGLCGRPLGKDLIPLGVATAKRLDQVHELSQRVIVRQVERSASAQGEHLWQSARLRGGARWDFGSKLPRRLHVKRGRNAHEEYVCGIACGPSARSPQGLQSYCKIYCEA